MTIIATGYEVSDIPVLDGVKKAGHTTIDNAIKQNYPDQPEPIPVPQPAPVVDLNTISQVASQAAQGPPFDGDIIISSEAAPLPAQPQPVRPSQQPAARPAQPAPQPAPNPMDEPVRITDPSMTPSYNNPSAPAWTRRR